MKIGIGRGVVALMRGLVPAIVGNIPITMSQ